MILVIYCSDYVVSAVISEVYKGSIVHPKSLFNF